MVILINHIPFQFNPIQSRKSKPRASLTAVGGGKKRHCSCKSAKVHGIRRHAPTHIQLSRKYIFFAVQVCPPSPRKKAKTLAPFARVVHGSSVPDPFYAPSLPNSAVQSAFRFKSSPDTVGLDPLMARVKSLTVKGGSRSCSESTSIQVISMAPGSPGEQGVSFSAPSTWT